MTARIRDRDRGARRVKQALEELEAGVTVKVGIHRDDGRTIVDEESGLTLAGLAAIHEYGAPDLGIPARAWLRSALDSAGNAIERRLAAIAKATVLTKRNPEPAFKSLGDEVVRTKIRAGLSTLEPLAPETIERKGSGEVLRETGFFASKIDARVSRPRRPRRAA